MGKVTGTINGIRKVMGFRVKNFTGDWSEHKKNIAWIKENTQKMKDKATTEKEALADADTPQAKWELACYNKRLTEADIAANRKSFQLRLAINILAGLVFFSMLISNVLGDASSLLYVVMVSMCMVVSFLGTMNCWFRLCQINDRALYSFGSWISGKEGC